MTKRKGKNNPYVTLETFTTRHEMLLNKIDRNATKVTEILWLLKGNPNAPGDMGIMGEIRDIKRDRKWFYALLTLIGLPLFFFLIKYFGGI